MEEEKEKDNFQSQNGFERVKNKKNTFQVKENHFDLKKDFESIKRNYKSRCYSTKILRDFVPQIRPKKSFCKPTFFKLNDNDIESKSIDDENEKDYGLDKISSCDEDEDDDESKNNSSSISSSEAGMDEEEEKQNEFKLDKNLYDKNILSSLKEEENNSDEDEYENLVFKKKKKHKKTEEEKSNLNNLRKEMSKIKSRTIVVKSKEMEEIIHHLNNNFKLGVNNGNNCYYDENYIKKENDINKNSIKLGHKDDNFSILDVLAIKNEKN